MSKLSSWFKGYNDQKINKSRHLTFDSPLICRYFSFHCAKWHICMIKIQNNCGTLLTSFLLYPLIVMIRITHIHRLKGIFLYVCHSLYRCEAYKHSEEEEYYASTALLKNKNPISKSNKNRKVKFSSTLLLLL